MYKEPHTICPVCSRSFLVATAERTGGVCMTCFKWPDWFAEKEENLRQMRTRKLCRTLDEYEMNLDPKTVISEFGILLAWDGIAACNPDDLVVISHALKKCGAEKCAQVIESYMDFLEVGCSPNGYFDDSLVYDFCDENADRVYDMEKEYEEAFRIEKPEERAAYLKPAL